MRVQHNKPQANLSTTISSTDPVKGVIHHCHILDSSGSMMGKKYNSAKAGIMKDIEIVKQQAISFPNITNTMTIIEFSGSLNINYHCYKVPIEKLTNINFRLIGNMTALYQTLGECIEKFIIDRESTDKVLIKVLTDGGENGSVGKYAEIHRHCPNLATLIKKVSNEGFTITFVGTDSDTKSIIANLNIDASNTLVHNNTGKGVEDSYTKTVGATQMFMRSMSAGEDVSKGFYTKIVN